MNLPVWQGIANDMIWIRRGTRLFKVLSSMMSDNIAIDSKQWNLSFSSSCCNVKSCKEVAWLLKNTIGTLLCLPPPRQRSAFLGHL